VTPDPPESAPLRKVGLLSPCGWGNLGDAATQDALLENLRARWPELELVGFYLNPADTERRHGIRCFPLYPGQLERASDDATAARPAIAGVGSPRPRSSRSLRQLVKRVPVLAPVLRVAGRLVGRLIVEVAFARSAYRQVRELDLLVMAGGGQIADDWGGAWRQPFTLFRWTFLARLAGIRIVFLSVGAGPLGSPLSRWFARRSMARADYISYRDAASRTFMESVGFGRAAPVSHDLAYGLPVSPGHGRDASLVSIGAMPWFDPRSWPEKDAATYAGYLDRMVALTRRLVERGYRVALFASDIHMDDRVIDDLLRLLDRPEHRATADQITKVPITQVRELIELLARSRFVIASRYHGVLLAHRVGTPALGLSYHPKVRSAMEEMDNLAYCLDLSTWTAADADRLLDAMEAEEPELRRRIATRVRTYERALARQYDEVFGNSRAGGGRPVPAVAADS
jgi:polysaccharide pyruvyl transferase WcaK-like protein